MECKLEQFRHTLLFNFCNGKNAAQAAKMIRDVYGEPALKDKQCWNWFDKFCSGDFSLKDEQRSGRPNDVKKLDRQIPHELKEMHSTKRINPCDLHLKCNEFDPCLRRIITGDKKWIIYNNVKV